MIRMRDSFIRGAQLASFALAALLALAAPVSAESQPPGTAPAIAELDYPELLIERTDQGFELPAQATAGRTLIAFENGATSEDEPDILRLPDGITLDDLRSFLAVQETAPAWFYEAYLPGGPGVVAPGQRSQAIVDLLPGQYAVFSVDDPGSVTGLEVVPDPAATPRPSEEPEATGVVTLDEFAFSLLEPLAAGPQVWRIDNAGEQPHQLSLAKIPDGTTLDDVMAHLTASPDATPAAGALDPAAIVTVGGLGFLSAGGTAWAVLDLEPGTYLALCYVPDQASGVPHAFMGMVSVFTVASPA